MYIINLDQEWCAGDGKCVEICPVSMFEMADGKATVVGNPDDCLGCESCVSVCDREAITLTEM